MMPDRLMRLCAAALLAACSLAYADSAGTVHIRFAQPASPTIAAGGENTNLGETIMAAKAEPPVVVVDGAGAKTHMGKQVAVKGIARNAKISAAVIAGDEVVYCLGLANWPGGLAGKLVLAHGMLERTEEFVVKRSPTGEISAGSDGPVWVLRGCRYEPG